MLALVLTGRDSGRQDALQAQTTPGCPAYPNNPVACENELAGDTDWDISGAGDFSIQGFATDMSVNVGQRVNFKIDTPSDNYRVDIYRLGYYGGAGARKLATQTITGEQNQPSCATDPTTGLVDCGTWSVSAYWDVPADAVSGVHIAKLTRLDEASGGSHIVFIVRNDAHQADVVFQTSDTTWQAYNRYGYNQTTSTGGSLYCGFALSNADTPYAAACAGRAAKVSYNRPIDTRGPEPRSFLFSGEYPAIRWLEANGYNVKYWSGVDTDRRGADLVATTKKPKIFLSVGHDEYWSGQQRTHVENARNAGVNLAFLSGNEVFWKTRWEPSIDGTSTSHRTLVSYKETLHGMEIDPSPDWTGTWRDTRFSAQARPENSLIGAIWTVNCCTTAINVPYTVAPLRFWRNTRVAALTSGSTTLAPGTLGYEWGEVLENGYQPAGLVRMSLTTATGQEKSINYGAGVETGTATHNLVLHRHNSGALIFGASTVQWSWGLDGQHDGNENGNNVADQAIQQATINLFADMGNVQPATLQAGADPVARPLVTAQQSTDIFAPTSSISSPSPGATVESGMAVTITGTAADSGGGQVAGVEVSVDGGATWKAAQGRTAWTYQWTPAAPGTVTIRTRAVDDSANLEVAGSGVSVTIGTGVCPCPNLWRASTTPESTFNGVSDYPENAPYELGVKFRSDIDGYITGIRFYKGAGNVGTHIGNLWLASTRENLATATFTNETPTGWQQVLFAEPVAITKDTIYVASYHTNVGHYAVTPGLLATAGLDAPPLHAPPTGEVNGNGVYIGGVSAYPDQSFNGNYYWVDVVFATSAVDETAPIVSNIRQTALDSSKLDVSWSTDEEASGRLDYSTDAGFAPAATQSIVLGTFKTSHKVNVTGLLPNTTYYFRITAADANGNAATVAAPTFTLPGPTLRDTADEDFNAGAVANTHVSVMGDGEVILAPIVGTEFSGTTLPAGWKSMPYTAQGASTIANGIVTVDGARFGTCTNDASGNCTVENGVYSPGHSLEFSAVFTGDAFQHAGLALRFDSGAEPWAIFSTHEGGNLWVRTNTGELREDINLGGTFLGGFHRYRIDWNANGTVSYYIDGIHRHTTTLTVTSLLRPVAASDFSVFGGAILVDWLRMTPHAAAGAFESRVFDAQTDVAWKSIQGLATSPAGTTLGVSVRVGNTPIPDGLWTEFTPVAVPSALDLTSRYIQYRLDMTTSDPRVSPSLEDIIITTEAAPVAANDSFNVAQNSRRVFPATGPGSLTFNDGDDDTPNDDLRVVAVTGPTNGAIALNSDGSVTYTPTVGYNGPDSFGYTVSDGLLTSSATVSINVTFVNQAPEANDNVYNVNEDSLLSVSAQLGLLANDFDVEGDALRAVLVSLPASGLLSLSPTGSFTYTPAENVSGAVTFSYKANDGALDSNVATVQIIINEVNDPPQTPKADAYNAQLNQPRVIVAPGVLDNDLDTEVGGVLTASLTQGPQNGVLQEFLPNGAFTYIPNQDFLGIDTFKYRTTDAQGATSVLEGTVTITIATKAVTDTVGSGGTVGTGIAVSPDDPLVSTVTTPIPATVSIAQGVIAGSASPTGYTFLNQQVNITVADATGAEITATAASPLVFTFAIDLSLIPQGQDHNTFEVFRNGVLVPNCPGATSIPAENLNPCVSAREGGTRVKLTILTTHASHWNMGVAEGGLGDNLVAHNDGIYSANYETPVLKEAPGVLRNDFGPETITATYVEGSAEGGTVVLQPSGAFTFTPAAGHCGPARFQYYAQTGVDVSNVATASFAVNCLPAATDDTVIVPEDSGANAITVLSNDTDPDAGQTLRVTDITQAANGTVAIGPSGQWVTYEPNLNFAGSDTFTYTVSDNKGGSDIGTVNVTVSNINDAPSFTKGANQTVLEDSAPQSVFNWATNISAGPSESGQSLEFLVTNDNAALFAVAPAIDAAGTLTYLAAPNAYGVATVAVQLRDNGGLAEGGADTSAAQTFTITVQAVNDIPSFVKGGDESLSEDYGTRTVPGWATAVSAGPANEADQSLTFVVTNDNNALFSTQPAIAADGTLTYDPAPNANGTANVSVTLRDSGGTANGGVDTSAAQVFSITLYLVNDAPSFTKGANQTVNEDAGATVVAGWATGMTAGPADEAGQALDFIVANDNTALFAVQPAIAANGTLTYTPAANAYGTASVSVRLHDDGGTANGGADTSAAQVFSITVNPVNDVPSFTKGDDQTVAEDAGAQSVLNWATSVSAGPLESAQALEFLVSADNAALFAVAPAIDAAGTLTFQVAANAYGAATVSVQLRDNGGVADGGVDTSAVQTFAITVTSVNDAPDALDDTAALVEDSGANAIDVRANDSIAPDTGETLTVTAVTQGANGSVTFTATGVSYTPNANFFGNDSFTYTISDGNGGSDTATVNVSVGNVNDAPDAADDSATVSEDSGANAIDVRGNDSFAPDADETLSVTAVTQGANGSVTFTATGVSYTPNANYFGGDSFTYTISDGNGGSDSATVNVTVANVNDAPDAIDDAVTVAEDSGANAITVLGNDSFAPDADETLAVTAVTQGTNGTVTFTGTGVSYTPNANYFGGDSFTYTISDGNGGSDTATVNVTVTAVNDAPDAVNDTKTVAEDSGATAITVLANDSFAPDTGETLTVTAVTQPANGSATFTATGVSFTPNANFFGGTSFTYTVSDGNGGSDTATVSVTVTAVNDNPTAVDDSTAVMQGSSANTIDVLANDSSAPDGTETLTISSVTQPANGTVAITSAGTRVTYTPAAGFNGTNTFTYTIGDGNGGSDTATVTVTVNPPPSLRIENISIAEGDSGFTTMAFPVNLSGPSTLTVTVNYQTFNGSARDGRDYVSTNGSITFQPGETSKTANVQIIGETTKEKDETLAVRLSSPVNATIARIEAVGIILDDDTTPTAQITSSKQSEGNGEFTGDGGALNELSFKVTLSNLSEIPVSVSYMTQGLGAAKAGLDFDALSGVLTFGEDDLVKYITIPIMGDRQHEALERVRLKLHSPVEMILNVVEVDGEIEDDDPAPSVSVSDVRVVEGANGTTNAVFTITLSDASGTPETVTFTTANGTATAGSDYTAVSGTVTFEENETSKAIIVPILGDGVIEPGETFTLTVANALGSDLILGKRTGTATIVNDDSMTWTNGTFADLSAGTAGTGAVISDATDGAVLLQPRYITDFNGTTLPNGWVKDSQGTVTFAAGTMTVSGATVRNNQGLGVGFAVEFGATFTDVSQWGGLTSMRFNSKLDSAGVPRLWVTTITGKSTSIDTQVPGSWMNAPHRFRIEWLPTGVVYSIDGTMVATHVYVFAANTSMQVTAFDLAGGGSFIVDWARVTPYALTGEYTSTVFDAGSSVTWQTASWAGAAPLGTAVVLQMRTAESPTDITAKAFLPVVAGAPPVDSNSGRYAQYRLVLTTTSNLVSPEVSEVALTYLTQ